VDLHSKAAQYKIKFANLASQVIVNLRKSINILVHNTSGQKLFPPPGYSLENLFNDLSRTRNSPGTAQPLQVGPSRANRIEIKEQGMLATLPDIRD
jgi:hypothetical protein